MRGVLKAAKGKIQQICDLLKKETIEPAQQQAAEILENAHLQADKIVEKAEKKAASILEKAEVEKKQKFKAFEASIALAMKQALSALREKIEKKLFQERLGEEVEKAAQNPELIAPMIQALSDAVEKEGLSEEMELRLPKAIHPEQIAKYLIGKTWEQLKHSALYLEELKGGVQLKIKDKNLVLDMSDQALTELLDPYIRKEFRSLLFQESSN